MSTGQSVDNEIQKTSQLLHENRGDILEAWKKQVRLEIPSAQNKSTSAIEDHMPQVIDEIALTMHEGRTAGLVQTETELAKKHGRQRANLGDYTLEEVLEEYRIAREIIIRELNLFGPLSTEAQCVIHRVLDRAIIKSGTEFAKMKQLENIDAQDRAKQAQDRAEIANRSKSDFLANMSHEIRTPLGAILGFTELLRDPNLNEPDRAKFADIVNRNGRQLSTLINDILDISKIEAGKLKLEYVPVSLPSIVAEVTTLMRGIAEQKGLKLQVDPWLNIPGAVLTDPTRLTQIISNLISNAIKFTSKGQVRVRLSREMSGTDDVFAVRVSDSGIGMTPEQSSGLFEAFNQADSSTTRRFGGTGLGLFLSKQLAIALGGDLALEKSEVQVGSTFVARFRASAQPDELLQTIEKTSRSAGINLSGIRILLAEDSPDNQLLVQRLLKGEGCAVDIANNGAEALEKAFGSEHDIVLMDIQMPVMDGYETTKLLRKSGYAKPIIALTANAMTEEKNRSISAGCNSHITKPINRLELLREIQKLTLPQGD